MRHAPSTKDTFSRWAPWLMTGLAAFPFAASHRAAVRSKPVTKTCRPSDLNAACPFDEGHVQQVGTVVNDRAGGVPVRRVPQGRGSVEAGHEDMPAVRSECGMPLRRRTRSAGGHRG